MDLRPNSGSLNFRKKNEFDEISDRIPFVNSVYEGPLNESTG